MSKKLPKLNTKYEDHDPDFQPETDLSLSSISQPLLTRSKPPELKISEKESAQAHSSNLNKTNRTISISSSSEEEELSSSFSKLFTEPNVESLQINSAEMSLTAAQLNEIVQAVIAAQQASSAPSKPKVIPEKLTDSNYTDWSKKMKNALKLNDLWIDPSRNPNTLNEAEKQTNERAALYMACFLDDKHSSFINDSNEKCFISAWNSIARFKEPRTSTILADIHRQIQLIKHKAGQSIETHLMMLEAQFSRFTHIKKTLADEHLVALTLASIQDSPDFCNVIHSAMWEDEATLTLPKIKSVLISTQRRQLIEKEEEAHHSKFRHHYSTKKFHNRTPKDPIKGWRCTTCEMDNHSNDNCFKRNKQQKYQKFSAEKSRKFKANNAEEETEIVNNVRAYSASTSSQRHSPYSSSHSTIKSRLGYTLQSHNECSEDVLDINHNSQDSDTLDYMSASDDEGTKEISKCHKNSKAFLFQTKTNQTSYNFNSTNIELTKHINHCDLLNLKSVLSKTNFKPLNFYKNEIKIQCNFSNNKNKTNLKSNSSLWYIDSGASIHMCCSKEFLTNFSRANGQNVIISDGSKIPIEGYGSLELVLKDNDNISRTITLKHVAVVPKLSVNLISVRELTTSDTSIIFSTNSCYIQKSKCKILFGKLKNSLYELEIKHSANITTALSCIHELHRKMSHKNISHISKIKDSLNIKVEKCDCSSECLACLQGKFHALPFPQKSVKPDNSRDIIATDVCGPFRVTSIGGSRYFVTFTCLHSDYTEVAAVKNKSQAKVELMNFISKCKNQFENPIKIIRSDRGGEYLDQELQTFLKKEGVIFQCTVPGNPQQNGVAERKNRTLLDAIRTNLISKNLPKFFWAEALYHANNTFNNIPKRAHSRTPREIFFGKSNNFQFIEFGLPVIYSTKPQGRSKLDERGSEGIFMGVDHNSKGFRIYTNQKIIIERNIKVLDKNKTKIKFQQDPSSDYNSLTDDTLYENPTQVPRRSERLRSKQANSVTELNFEPKTYKQAISCKDKDKWILAMDQELQTIHDNLTWTPTKLPKDRNAIGCRWVFKIKQGETDDSVKYKARLVAQGYTQKFGVDFDQVFAPVTRSATFRTLLSVASANNLIVKQYDVKSAFLNGKLEEEIYMKPPPGSPITDKVLRLNKSLYGLKQAARVWNKTLNNAMTQANFKQSFYDECLYVFKNESDICYAIVHVDDMIFASNSETLIDVKTKFLNNTFELKCLGNVKNYLGIQVSRNKEGHFAISQPNYIMKVANEFGLENTKGSKYPLDPNYHNLKDNNMMQTNTEYRKLIGMLLYISTNTRPDVSAAVGILAQRVSKPRELDYTEALRIIKYLVATKDEKLKMFSKNESKLLAFSDSDWAQDPVTRKSISGIICKVFGAPVSWSSRKQDVVSTSTTESEFYAISEAIKEILWLKNLLSDFNVQTDPTTDIFCDNQSTIKMLENSSFSARTKHIDVRLHFVRECVEQRKIQLQYCPSEDNIADILTKPLAGTKIEKLRRMTGLNI